MMPHWDWVEWAYVISCGVTIAGVVFQGLMCLCGVRT